MFVSISFKCVIVDNVKFVIPVLFFGPFPESIVCWTLSFRNCAICFLHGLPLALAIPYVSSVIGEFFMWLCAFCIWWCIFFPRLIWRDVIFSFWRLSLCHLFFSWFVWSIVSLLLLLSVVVRGRLNVCGTLSASWVRGSVLLLNCNCFVWCLSFVFEMSFWICECLVLALLPVVLVHSYRRSFRDTFASGARFAFVFAAFVDGFVVWRVVLAVLLFASTSGVIIVFSQPFVYFSMSIGPSFKQLICILSVLPTHSLTLDLTTFTHNQLITWWLITCKRLWIFVWPNFGLIRRHVIWCLLLSVVLLSVRTPADSPLSVTTSVTVVERLKIWANVANL